MSVGRKTVLDQIFIVKLLVHLQHDLSSAQCWESRVFGNFLTLRCVKVYHRRKSGVVLTVIYVSDGALRSSREALNVTYK